MLRMSGVFWEPEKQPNLCEAASGFTLSTVNLLVAIPMAAVDTLVAVTLFLASTIWTLMGPVMEYLVSGLVMVMEMLGLERLTPDQTILSLVAVSGSVYIYNQFSRQSRPKERMFCSLLTTVEAILLFCCILDVPALEKAVFPRAIMLGLALQLAKFCLNALFVGFSNYSLQRKPNQMDVFAAGIVKAIDMESSVALMVAAFGYPSFSGEDPVTAYLCLVPAIATHLVIQNQVLPHVAPEDQVDSPNGEAVAVADPPPAEETVLEKDLSGQEAAQETTQPEAVSEEVVPDAEAAGDGSSVETIEDKKTEAMIRRLQACVTGLYSWVGGKVLVIISPICQLVSKILSAITSLPWTCISLFTFTLASNLLWTAAWYHLTSNPLALALPVSSLLVPPVLEKITVIPTAWRPYLAKINGLAFSLVQCLVITGGEEVQE